MQSKFFQTWIGEDNHGNHTLKVHLGQFDRNSKEEIVSIGIETNSLQEPLHHVWCPSFEEGFTKLAAQWRKAADDLLEFGKRAQALMDSGEVTMTPMERATAKEIAQFFFDRGNKMPPGDEREGWFEIGHEIGEGRWK